MVLDGWLVTSLPDGRISLRRVSRLTTEEWRVAADGLEVFRESVLHRFNRAFFDAALRMTRSYGGTSTHDLFVVFRQGAVPALFEPL